MIKLLLSFNFFEFICKKIVKYFNNYLHLKSSEVEKLYLGIMIIFLNLSEMILIFTISFFIGIIKCVVLFTIIFGTLRLTAAGVHCKNTLSCTILTSIIYISSTYISMNYPLNIYVTFIISVVSTVLLYKYAPADTENRPILGIEHRKKLKLQTTIISCIFIFINLFLLNKILFNLTMFALMFEAISVLPCTYKLMKTNYNNYEKYEFV